MAQCIPQEAGLFCVAAVTCSDSQRRSRGWRSGQARGSAGAAGAVGRPRPKNSVGQQSADPHCRGSKASKASVGVENEPNCRAGVFRYGYLVGQQTGHPGRSWMRGPKSCQSGRQIHMALQDRVSARPGSRLVLEGLGLLDGRVGGGQGAGLPMAHGASAGSTDCSCVVDSGRGDRGRCRPTGNSAQPLAEPAQGPGELCLLRRGLRQGNLCVLTPDRRQKAQHGSSSVPSGQAGVGGRVVQRG